MSVAADSGPALGGLAMLARAFWGPEPDLCAELMAPAARAELLALAEVLGAAGSPARDLAAFLDGRDDPAGWCESLETDYVRLFISGLGGVPAPLYQSCYQGEGLVMGPPARHMARRLAEFGLEPGEKAGEPPDHLAMELELLLWLLENGREAEAGDFAGRVLAPWLPAFQERLAGEPADSFWPLAAALARALADFFATA